MTRRFMPQNTFDAALDRLLELYEAGHRLVVSFSGGKDSTICLELSILAATMTGRLPVEVVMRDEEIMLPGTFEYCERVAARPEVDFHWVYACQPVVNIFNRAAPYFWVFDPLLDPEQWVRQPPAFAQKIDHNCIEYLTFPGTFPPAEGKELFAVLGLRADESTNRRMGVFSSGGHLTKANRVGTRRCRPIYDWSDSDVWKAIADNKWDYNTAYDAMHRLGVPRRRLRIAPPTLNAAGAKDLMVAAKAWPAWFEKVCNRLPGARSVAMFGRLALEPIRYAGETWEQCFKRTCITDAPEWVRERAQAVADVMLKRHSRHAADAFPENTNCPRCRGLGSWRTLALAMYMGDPFDSKQRIIPEVEPEFFRPGAGKWHGSPAFA